MTTVLWVCNLKTVKSIWRCCSEGFILFVQVLIVSTFFVGVKEWWVQGVLGTLMFMKSQASFWLPLLFSYPFLLCSLLFSFFFSFSFRFGVWKPSRGKIPIFQPLFFLASLSTQKSGAKLQSKLHWLCSSSAVAVWSSSSHIARRVRTMCPHCNLAYPRPHVNGCPRKMGSSGPHVPPKSPRPILIFPQPGPQASWNHSFVRVPRTEFASCRDSWSNTSSSVRSVPVLCAWLHSTCWM